MRYDQTNWLIHFVSDRDGEQSNCVTDESHYNYYTNDKLEHDASAFAILKRIIQLGGLIPGYSFRSGKTTIYGGKPAICVTEMPIYSFAKYVQKRNNSERASGYGIALLKKEFFLAGGRPVIYGLSAINSYGYEINDPDIRILDSSVLTKQEQYRYVAYNLSENKWIDWSHEREWRWIVSKENSTDIYYSNGDIEGLSVFSGKENYGYFSKVCIIVWNREEAKEIQKILTGLYLCGYNNYDTPFSKKLIKSSIIIVLSDLISSVENDLDLKSQTIEGIQERNLYQSILIPRIDKKIKEKIDLIVANIGGIAENAKNEYIELHPNSNDGLFGYANVVSFDVTDPVTQYLIEENYASGPFDGKIHMNIKTKYCVHSSQIDYEKYICQAVYSYLSKNLSIKFHVDSRLD